MPEPRIPPASSDPDGTRPRRVPRALLYLAALVLHLGIAALLIHHWDGFVFLRSVENLVLHGESPYATIENDPPYTYPGVTVPPLPQWYAYPPLDLLLSTATYGPYVLVGHPWAFLSRVLVKLPLVLGALALPALSRRLALVHGARPGSADRLERFLLFNPFLLLMGTAWGMTEVLLAAFLAGSLLALHHRRPGLSGILFGLASLVKIFPLFVYPILLVWVLRRERGVRAAGLHLLGAAGTFVLVSLPFYLQHPQGFVRAILLMHLSRPPGGYSAWHLVDAGVGAVLGPAWRAEIGLALSVLTLTAFGLLLLGQCVRTWQDGPEPRRILERLALVFVVFLLLNKVLNEQYLALALVLLTWASFADPAPGRGPARLLWALTAGFTAAAVLRNLQIFLLVPGDEATRLVGVTGAELLESGRVALGVSLPMFRAATQALALAALGAGAWRMVPRVGAFIHDSVVALLEAARRVPLPRFTPRRTATAVALVALLFLPSLAVGVLRPGLAAEPVQRDPAPVGPQLVGAYYEVWWKNPTNDPYARYGNWDLATTSPLGGYYTSRTGTFSEAIDSMRASGVDFALLPLRTHDHDTLHAFVYESEARGFRFAPLYSLQWVHERENRTILRPQETPPSLPVTKESFDALGDYLLLPGADLRSRSLVDVDGRPVAYLQDLDALRRHDTPPEYDYVRPFLIARADPVALTALYGSVLWEQVPQLLDPPRLAGHPREVALRALWDEAYQAAAAEGWRRVLERLDREAPGLGFVVDGSAAAQPGFPAERVVARFAAWEHAGPLAAHPASADVDCVTLWPAYNARLARPTDPSAPAWRPDGLRYAEEWAAHADAPCVLLYAWNAHQEGAALEPTQEYGTLFVDATRRWTAYAEARSQATPT